MVHLSRLLEEVIPFGHYMVRKKRASCLENSDRILEQPQYTKYASIHEETLKLRLREEKARATAMDDKTFKLTLSLSVALTIVGFTSIDLAKHIPHATARICFAGLIIMAIFYFTASGFVALGAIRTRKAYGYGTDILFVNPKYIQTCCATWLAKAETQNYIRHLRNETAFQALRNGFLLLWAAAALITSSFIA